MRSSGSATAFCLSSEAGSDTSPAGKTPQPSAAGPQPVFAPGALRTLVYCCLVLLIGYLLGGMKSAYDAAWERNMIVEGVVTHYGLFKGLKPGLHEALAQADDNLGKIATVVAGLAKEHVELAGDAGAEKKEQWDSVGAALWKIRDFVRQMDRATRSVPKSAAVERMIRAREIELEGMREQSAEGAAPAAPPKTAEPAKEPKATETKDADKAK